MSTSGSDHGASGLTFKTFAFTLRPLDGVTDEQIEKFVKWVKKHCEYYHVITEKESHERHIHAGVVLKFAKTRSNVGVMIKCLFKGLSVQEYKVLLGGIKIMYNDDFIRKYLNKDDHTVVIESCLPEAGTMESYYPPKPVDSTGTKRKCSAYYHELESLWYKFQEPHHEVNTMCVRDFLFKMMYSERCLPVIRDDKQIIQTARHLVRWILKKENSSIQLPPFESEE